MTSTDREQPEEDENKQPDNSPQDVPDVLWDEILRNA